MKKLFKCLALIGIGLSQPVSAEGTWTVGQVIPNWSGSVAWTPPYPVDGTHPADTYVPAAVGEEAGFTASQWTFTEAQRAQIGTSDEAKQRIVCTPSFARRADPMLFPGVYPAGHDHTWFGWMGKENAQNADYTTVRSDPRSSCQGGPLNPSPYWKPSVKHIVNGLALTVMPDILNIYYTHAPDKQDVTTSLRRNLGFIGGADPMNYNDTARRAEYAAAGLEYPGSPDTPAGFLGIQCVPNSTGNLAAVLSAHAMKSPNGTVQSTEARYTKGPNGEDPWNGACTAGEIIIMNGAPGCWDATNLRSPNGRDHFRYSGRKPDNSLTDVCPLNYVKVMHFASKTHYTHKGWSVDLKDWYLASDRMNAPSTPADPTSKDPCRQTGPYFCNFSTLHFDLIISWHQPTMDLWQRNCGGLTIGGINGTHADCGTGALDTNVAMRYGGAPPVLGLSPNPILSKPPARATVTTEGQRYFPVDAADQSQGALTAHVDH